MMNLNLTKVKNQIVAEQKKIAVSRDRLRVLVEDAEDLLNDLDCADEDITHGVNLLQCAVDTLSRMQ
jgi:hypothetical protein